MARWEGGNTLVTKEKFVRLRRLGGLMGEEDGEGEGGGLMGEEDGEGEGGGLMGEEDGEGEGGG